MLHGMRGRGLMQINFMFTLLSFDAPPHLKFRLDSHITMIVMSNNYSVTTKVHDLLLLPPKKKSFLIATKIEDF